jgi:hypothetical protein
MHFIKKIDNATVQISLFSWNGKYIVKFEMNQMEQTFKISEIDCISAEEVEEAIDNEFVVKVIERFKAMGEEWFGRF